LNQLVQGLLTKFVEDQAFVGLSQSEAFERLAVWCVLARSLPGGSSIEDLMAGNETVGIDAVAVMANEELLLDQQDAEDVTSGGHTIDVDFTFVQAKTSEKFERSEILNFGESVIDFFSITPGLVSSAFIQERRKAKDELYSKSPLFRNRRPNVHLAYVTSGSVPDDPNINSAVDSVVSKLVATSLFDEVQFELLGAAEVHRSFSQIENREEATFNFPRRVTIPKIRGVREAYLGVVSAIEFLKLIEDEDGVMKTSVFYDNVRDFQDMNLVNQGIAETLMTPDTAILFPVLNNGVTVVAQSVRPVGEDVTVEDYQIVNGCQTSHVIHAAKDHLTAEILIPLRLVITDEDQVASNITKATNRQTPVDEGNLQALTDFQKELEAFFGGQIDKRRLYYERRSKQYNSQKVEQTRVISPLVQMRAFAAFALDEPHSGSRYYRGLYDRVPVEIFNSTHRHEPYYTAALAWYRLDVALRRKLLDPAFRVVRYPLLTALKYVAIPGQIMPALSSRQIVEYCEKLNSVLVDEQKSSELFRKAGEIVLSGSQGTITRDVVKRERFTRDLLDRLRATNQPSM
jgi:hypothetical protein